DFLLPAPLAAGRFLLDFFLPPDFLAGRLVDFFAGAFLAGAFLAGAFLAGAFLPGFFLPGAFFAGDFLAGARLAGASSDGASAGGASLAGCSAGGVSSLAGVSGSCTAGGGLSASNVNCRGWLLACLGFFSGFFMLAAEACAANMAPCGSRAAMIQSPPGTSMGPLMIWPPADFTFLAVWFTSLTCT